MKNTVLFFLITVLLYGCKGADSPLTPDVGEQFELKIGDSAIFPSAAFTVTFEDIEEDSRCPVDAQCVWSGNARILVQVNGTNEILNTHIDSKNITIAGMKLELLSLMPYPNIDRPINRKDYTATLLISRY